MNMIMGMKHTRWWSPPKPRQRMGLRKIQMRAEVQIQPNLQRGATQTQQHRQRGMVQTRRHRQQETVQAQRLRRRMREMQHKAAVQGIPLLRLRRGILRRHRNRPIRIMRLHTRKRRPIRIMRLHTRKRRPIRIMQLRMRKCPPIPITIMKVRTRKVITGIPATAIMTDAVQ